MKYFDKSIL